MDYDDFSIWIEPERGNVRGTHAQSGSGATARGTFTLPVQRHELSQLLRDLGTEVRGAPVLASKIERDRHLTLPPTSSPRLTPQELGHRLFDALFSGRVRTLFEQSWGRVETAAEMGLRIRLHFDLEDRDLVMLSSLPWEFLYWQERREFLSLSRFTPVVRQVAVPQPARPLNFESPLRILVAMSPSVGRPLNLDEERRRIEEAWGHDPQIEVVFIDKVTLGDLRRRLARESFHVLHFMGHGNFSTDTGEGVLTFGNEEVVTGRSLAAVLHDRRELRLVFLNACDTARGITEDGDPFAGVATALVKAGLPAVLAMQFPISDTAGIAFSSAFYDQLVRGRDLHTATAEGRQAILAENSHSQEWGTPVLFERIEIGQASLLGRRDSDARESRTEIAISWTKFLWLALVLFGLGLAALVAYDNYLNSPVDDTYINHPADDTYVNRPPEESQTHANVLTEVVIRVRHRDGQALAGVLIGTPGGSMDRSDDDGRAWVLLPSEKSPGDPITVQVRPILGDPWLIISPEGGRTFVPSKGNFVDVLLIRQSEQRTESSGPEVQPPLHRPFNYADFKRGKIIRDLSQGFFAELDQDRESVLFYLIGLHSFLLEEAASHDQDGTCAVLADASLGLEAANQIMKERGLGTLDEPDVVGALETFFNMIIEIRNNPAVPALNEAMIEIHKAEGRQDGMLLAFSYRCSNPYVISFYENAAQFVHGEVAAHTSELGENRRSQVFQACDRAIRFNLNGPATEGDLEEVCACVERAFASARTTVPEKYRDNFLWQRPEGEVLNPTAIGHASRGDLVPARVRSAADVLNWEVRGCLGRLPLREQLTGDFARDWTDKPDPRWDYLGPIVSPGEGPAGPVDKTLGGLLFFKLKYTRHVLWYAFLRDEVDVEGRNSASEFLDSFHPDASELVVLDCSYRTQAENGYNRWMSTRSYFYWYQPEWNPLAEELLKAAPADSPLHKIGPPRETCPLREPQS